MKHTPRQFVQVVVVVALAAPSVFGQQSVPPSSTAPSATADDRTDPAPSPLKPATQGLAFDWFLQAGLSGNPSLAEAHARVSALRGKWTQSGLRTNPNFGYTSSDVGIDGGWGIQGMFLSKQVITGGKLELNRRVVSQEIARAEQNWAAQEARVRNDVRIAFFKALLAQHRLAVTKDLVAIGDEEVAAAEARLRAREVGRVHVLQAKIAADNIRLLLARAENEQRKKWQQLTAVANVPDLDLQPVTGDVEHDLPQLDWQTAVDRLVNESPQIAAAAANVERARWQYQRELAGQRRDINFNVSVMYDHGPLDTIAGVQVGVPLQIHDRNQGNIARAGGEVREAEAALARVQLDLRNRLAAVYEQYATGRQHAQRYSGRILPAARETLELVHQAYKNKELDYLNVLSAQQTYSRSMLDYLNALEQVWEAAVQIDGLLLSGSLNRVD